MENAGATYRSEVTGRIAELRARHHEQVRRQDYCELDPAGADLKKKLEQAEGNAGC